MMSVSRDDKPREEDADGRCLTFRSMSTTAILFMALRWSAGGTKRTGAWQSEQAKARLTSFLRRWLTAWVSHIGPTGGGPYRHLRGRGKRRPPPPPPPPRHLNLPWLGLPCRQFRRLS